MHQLPVRNHFDIYSQIPNIVTSFRLASAMLLLALSLATNMACQFFLPLFVVAAVSDMLDGFLARRLNLCTEFGAKLDSISDLSLYIAVFVFLLLYRTDDISASGILFFIGFLIQFIHLLFSYTKHKQFPAYHSSFSRFSAYLIFFALVAYWLLGFPYAFSLIAIFWIASSLEGLIISSILQKPTENVSSIIEAIRLSRR